MNTVFMSLRNATKHLAYPFIFSAAFMIVGGILFFTPLKSIDAVSRIWKDYEALIVSILCVGYIVYFECKCAKKAIAATAAFMITDISFFCFGNYHLGLIASIALAFLSAGIIKGVRLEYGYLILLFSGLLLGMGLGALSPLINDMARALCGFFSGKGALFGAINNFYCIVFDSRLDDMLYYNDYSGAMLVGDEIVTGVKDIFALDNAQAGTLVSKYLSGKYIANIFVPAGTYVCVYKRLEKNELNALTLALLLSAVFGSNVLFFAYIFLFNPFIYLGNMLSIFIGYLITTLIDIRCGYIENASIYELIKYGDKWLYFIPCAIVIVFLSYFISRLLMTRFDIRGRRILPREVKQIISALGGEENIERISRGRLYVKNPNLINILKIDCDIHENEVTLFYDELNMLKDYF